MKHHNQEQLKKERVCSPHSLSSKALRVRTQAGQEPGGRSRCRGYGGMLLTGLLPMACSACFLIEPGPTAQGWHHPQWAGPSLPINCQSEKCPQVHFGEHFLNCGPSSKMIPVDVKFTRTTTDPEITVAGTEWER